MFWLGIAGGESCNAGSIPEAIGPTRLNAIWVSSIRQRTDGRTEGAIAIWELGEYGPFERYRARDSAGRADAGLLAPAPRAPT